MSNYNNLKTAIQQVIKKNGKQEITGNILKSALLAMVNSIGENYQYVGIATPELDPGSPDQNVMYITSKNGVYTNFNNLQVENEIAVLTFNGAWAKQTIYSLETINDVQSRASQVYENLAAIEASGETNPNKIYIDGETLIPYVYKDGKFMPFKGEVNNEYYNENIYIPFYKCSLPTQHKKSEFAIPINGDLDDLFVFSYLNFASSQIRRVKNGKVIWEILQNIYIGMLYKHTVNNDVVFYGNYAFVRGRITGLAKIDLSDGIVEFNKEVITEYENISLYKDYIIATGENKIVIIDPNLFSVYKQIDIEGGKTNSINSYADRVLISCSKNLYIIKDIDSDPIVISGSNIISAYYIKHLINSNVDSYLLYDSGITRLLTEDSSIDLTSNEIFNSLGFSPQFVINNSNYAGNAIIYCVCNNGYLTIVGYVDTIRLQSLVSDFITYSRVEEIMKYFGNDYYIRRVGDIFYKVKIIGYAEN